jgi:hypothetical protein
MSKFNKISAVTLAVLSLIFYLTFRWQIDPATKLANVSVKAGYGKLAILKV